MSAFIITRIQTGDTAPGDHCSTRTGASAQKATRSAS